MVCRVRQHYDLKTRYERLRQRGMLTLIEVAARLGVSTWTIKTWRKAGLLRAHAYNDKSQYVYEPPGDDAPVRYRWKGISQRRHLEKVSSNPNDEVQYEA